MADVLDLNDAVELDVDEEGDQSVLRLKDKVTKRKGRGFGGGAGNRSEKVRHYESVDGGEGSDALGPQKCKSIKAKEHRFKELKTRFKKKEAKFKKIESKFKKREDKFKRIKARFRETAAEFMKCEAEFKEIKRKSQLKSSLNMASYKDKLKSYKDKTKQTFFYELLYQELANYFQMQANQQQKQQINYKKASLTFNLLNLISKDLYHYYYQTFYNIISHYHQYFANKFQHISNHKQKMSNKFIKKYLKLLKKKHKQ